MKKKLLFISLFAFGTVNAQFTDDIESYALGSIHSGNWTSWSGSAGAEDGIVTNFRASSGSQSILIKEGSPTGQDCVLDLATSTGASNVTSGQWTLEFKMYIPTDSAAYYNFQEIVPIGAGSFGFELFFGDTTVFNSNFDTVINTVGVMMASGNTINFNYSNDTWMTFTHYFNIDNDSMNVLIDGVSIYNGPAYTNDYTNQAYGSIAAIDFYAFSPKNKYYIDDINFSAGFSKVNEIDATTQLSVYPNPVTDVLNVVAGENITSVTVYDVMGKTIKTLTPNALTLTVDMADLPAGAYMVRVDMGDKSKVVKVLK